MRILIVFLTDARTTFPLYKKERERRSRPTRTLMMELPDSRKSFRICLVVLTKYRLWQTATQPATLP